MFLYLVAQPTILHKVIQAQRKGTKLEGMCTRIMAGDEMEGWSIVLMVGFISSINFVFLRKLR